MSGDYEVGYRKPPKAHRFKPGQSGNPKGRPKKSALIAERIMKAFNEQVTVRTADGEVRISKFDAIVQQILAKAAKGDARAQRLVMNLWKEIGGASEENAPSGGVLVVPAPYTLETTPLPVEEVPPDEVRPLISPPGDRGS